MDLKEPGSTFRALGLTSGIGFVMAACVAGGYYGGRYLDSKFGTEPGVVIGSLLLCMAAGGFGGLNMVKKAMEEIDKKELEG